MIHQRIILRFSSDTIPLLSPYRMKRDAKRIFFSFHVIRWKSAAAGEADESVEGRELKLQEDDEDFFAPNLAPRLFMFRNSVKRHKICMRVTSTVNQLAPFLPFVAFY